MKTVLFHRDFQSFTGGHLKVWNYFSHVETNPGHRAQIHFSADSRWDETNPWIGRRTEVLSEWQPERAEVLFLGGFDWIMLPEAERDHYRCPIVNLIQHVHHGDPAHALSGFLRHRAIRICVSAEVRAAIEKFGVNGPTFVIPNGIDLAELPRRAASKERPVDWLICGLKEDRSKLARDLARQLATEGDWGWVETLTKLLPRAEFLAALARAGAAVLLPRETEGFYLPALEAMALGTLVVCPDCVGNRSFCRHGENALVPPVCDVEHLLAAMRTARANGSLAESLMVNGLRTASEHTLARERAAFHELLASVNALW